MEPTPSSPHVAPQQVTRVRPYLLAGFVSKKSWIKSSWSPRYLVLTATALYYFKRKEEDELFGQLQHRFPIEQITIQSSKSDPSGFTIASPKSTIKVRATNPQEAETWKGAITEVQQQFLEKQRTPNPSSPHKLDASAPSLVTPYPDVSSAHSPAPAVSASAVVPRSKRHHHRRESVINEDAHMSSYLTSLSCPELILVTMQKPQSSPLLNCQLLKDASAAPGSASASGNGSSANGNGSAVAPVLPPLKSVETVLQRAVPWGTSFIVECDPTDNCMAFTLSTGETARFDLSIVRDRIRALPQPSLAFPASCADPRLKGLEHIRLLNGPEQLELRWECLPSIPSEGRSQRAEKQPKTLDAYEEAVRGRSASPGGTTRDLPPLAQRVRSACSATSSLPVTLGALCVAVALGFMPRLVDNGSTFTWGAVVALCLHFLIETLMFPRDALPSLPSPKLEEQAIAWPVGTQAPPGSQSTVLVSHEKGAVADNEKLVLQIQVDIELETWAFPKEHAEVAVRRNLSNSNLNSLDSSLSSAGVGGLVPAAPEAVPRSPSPLSASGGNDRAARDEQTSPAQPVAEVSSGLEAWGGWSEADWKRIILRGKTYLTDKKKIPADDFAFKLVWVDVHSNKGPAASHMCSRYHSYIHRGCTCPFSHTYTPPPAAADDGSGPPSPRPTYTLNQPSRNASVSSPARSPQLGRTASGASVPIATPLASHTQSPLSSVNNSNNGNSTSGSGNGSAGNTSGSGNKPLYLIVNMLVPGDPSINFVVYFKRKDKPPASDDQKTPLDRALDRFLDGSDEYRNSRFKFIPCVVESNWVVKRGVGQTPAILGRKLTTHYYRVNDEHHNYMEIDVDVGSSSVGSSIFSLVKGYCSTIVIDQHFLLEGTTGDELPEKLLGGVRMSHITVANAFPLPPELPPPSQFNFDGASSLSSASSSGVGVSGGVSGVVGNHTNFSASGSVPASPLPASSAAMPITPAIPQHITAAAAAFYGSHSVPLQRQLYPGNLSPSQSQLVDSDSD